MRSWTVLESRKDADADEELNEVKEEGNYISLLLVEGGFARQHVATCR